MEISYLCIVVTIFIPLVSAAYAKFSVKGYDNHSPREFLAKLEGKGRRANYAQQNAFEAFPPFAIGVVVAHQMNADSGIVNILAITFVTMRILYAYFYINDQHILRSVVWFISLFATIGLYFVGM